MILNAPVMVFPFFTLIDIYVDLATYRSRYVNDDSLYILLSFCFFNEFRIAHSDIRIVKPSQFIHRIILLK